MQKFLVLYQSTVPASEQLKNATPAQAKAGMDAWMAWAGRLNGATAAAAGSSPVGGYSILQAESKDALMALLKNHPHFMAPGASIEAFEFLPMPGM
jgi:hypothetical protein